MSLQSQLQLDC